jgi:hypothetical protein
LESHAHISIPPPVVMPLYLNFGLYVGEVVFNVVGFNHGKATARRQLEEELVRSETSTCLVFHLPTKRNVHIAVETNGCTYGRTLD